MEFDVCIVGAGPAGLSAAIKLKQVHASWGSADDVSLCLQARKWQAVLCIPLQECKAKDKDLSVCVVEKGAEVGE